VNHEWTLAARKRTQTASPSACSRAIKTTSCLAAARETWINPFHLVYTGGWRLVRFPNEAAIEIASRIIERSGTFANTCSSSAIEASGRFIPTINGCLAIGNGFRVRRGELEEAFAINLSPYLFAHISGYVCHWWVSNANSDASNGTRSTYLDLRRGERTSSDNPLLPPFPLARARESYQALVALGWKSVSWNPRVSIYARFAFTRAFFDLPSTTSGRHIETLISRPFSSRLPPRLGRIIFGGLPRVRSLTHARFQLLAREIRARIAPRVIHLAAPISRVFNRKRESRREMISRRLFGIQSDSLRDSYSLPRTTYSIIIIASSEVEWRCWRSREITTASGI